MGSIFITESDKRKAQKAKQVKRIRTACEKAPGERDHIFEQTHTQSTHVDEKHVEKSNQELLTRILDEDRDTRATTSFYDKTITDFLIQEAIWSKAPDISDAMTRLEDAGKYNQKFAIEADMSAYMDKEEPYDEMSKYVENHDFIGYGFMQDNKTNAIQGFYTNNLRIVMKQDANVPIGFTIITAYLTLDSTKNKDAIKPMEIDLASEIQKTSVYENATSMQRAILNYQCSGKPDIKRVNYDYENDAAYINKTDKNLQHTLQLRYTKTYNLALNYFATTPGFETNVESPIIALQKRIKPNWHGNRANLDYEEIEKAVQKTMPDELAVIKKLMSDTEQFDHKKHMRNMSHSNKDRPYPNMDMPDDNSDEDDGPNKS